MIQRSLIVFFTCLLLVSCKSEFEKLRTSNDPEKIYAAANKYFDSEEWFKAQNLYEIVIPFYRGKEEAEKLFYNYAYTHYNMGDFILSSHYFNSFSKSFYNSPMKEECEYMSAYSNYRMSPNFKLDQSPSEKAIDAFQSFINKYPYSERIPDCNTLIDEMRAKMERKSFSQGLLYYDLKAYKSAIHSFENTLKDYPDSKKTEEIRFLILKSKYEYAINSIYEKRAERLHESMSSLNAFIKKYPKSKNIGEVKNLLKSCTKNYKKYKS